MWCLGCGYELVGQEDPRCPECGREFDPDDASTFRSEEDVEAEEAFSISLAVGLAIGSGVGLSIGTALGAAFGNVGLGIAIGMGVGAAGGMVVTIILQNVAKSE